MKFMEHIDYLGNICSIFGTVFLLVKLTPKASRKIKIFIRNNKEKLDKSMEFIVKVEKTLLVAASILLAALVCLKFAEKLFETRDVALGLLYALFFAFLFAAQIIALWWTVPKVTFKFEFRL